MGALGFNRYSGFFGPPEPNLFGSSGQPAPPQSAREAFLGSSPRPSIGPLGLSLFATPPAPPRSNIHIAFQTCISNIELDNTRAERAKQHYNAIKDWLESRLPGVEVRRVGSFQRHTKIRPATVNGVTSPIDIDALVCFGDAQSIVYYGGTTGLSCLEAVRNALAANGVYKLKEPTIDHPVVSLSYASEFFIELVPCYRNKLQLEDILRDPPSYLVCNSSNDWEPADYDYDSKYISQANKDADGKLIPAIKLIKQFCRNQSLGLKSFQIELLCVKLLTPFITVMREQGLTWEWQDLLTVFLLTAPAILEQDLSLPGSRTKCPPVENAFYLGIRLKNWGELFGKLSKEPDTAATLKLFNSAFGERFPAA